VNVISIIHFCYTIVFSWAIKPTGFNSEFGTVPVTFHMELKKRKHNARCRHAEYNLLHHHCAFETVTKPMKYTKNKSPHIMQKSHSAMQVQRSLRIINL